MCSATFISRVTNKEYRINFSFNCDSSNVVYMLECSVCGVQYVGSTCTLFKVRLNNYTSCNLRFNGGASGVPQADIFRHFVGEGYRGFLEDIRVVNLDKLSGNGRQQESFWQYKLDTFVSLGLNIRQIDCCGYLLFPSLFLRSSVAFHVVGCFLVVHLFPMYFFIDILWSLSGGFLLYFVTISYLCLVHILCFILLSTLSQIG